MWTCLAELLWFTIATGWGLVRSDKTLSERSNCRFRPSVWRFCEHVRARTDQQLILRARSGLDAGRRERGDELEHFYHKSQQLGSAHSIFSKAPGDAAAISSAKLRSLKSSSQRTLRWRGESRANSSRKWIPELAKIRIRFSEVFG